MQHYWLVCHLISTTLFPHNIFHLYSLLLLPIFFFCFLPFFSTNQKNTIFAWRKYNMDEEGKKIGVSYMLCGCVCVCVCERCIFFRAFPRAHRHPASTIYNFFYIIFFNLSLLHSLTLISCCFAWDRTYHPQKFGVLFFFFFFCYMHFFCATQFFYFIFFAAPCCWMFVCLCICAPILLALYVFRVHFPTKTIEGWMGHIYVKE